MKIMVGLMLWGKVLMNWQWFFHLYLCIPVPKEAAKNKIYSWIYQIFTEHLLCQDFPNAVSSQDAFRWYRGIFNFCFIFKFIYINL